MIQFSHEESNTTRTVEQCPGKPAGGNKPYILVVDDEPSITAIVLMMLEMEGYDALAIGDSPRVLPFLQRLQSSGTQPLPALILLDLMMPGLSGYELAAQLMQHPAYAQIPIIIMTADYRVHSARDVPGAADLLSKPFQVSTLLNKVERYLSRVPCA